MLHHPGDRIPPVAMLVQNEPHLKRPTGARVTGVVCPTSGLITHVRGEPLFSMCWYHYDTAFAPYHLSGVPLDAQCQFAGVDNVCAFHRGRGREIVLTVKASARAQFHPSLCPCYLRYMCFCYVILSPEVPQLTLSIRDVWDIGV